jgi:hypothetical protein
MVAVALVGDHVIGALRGRPIPPGRRTRIPSSIACSWVDSCRWPEVTSWELLADDAQVVGRLEVGNPVVEETDAVRPAKAVQFIEPDRPLAQPLSAR